MHIGTQILYCLMKQVMRMIRLYHMDDCDKSSICINWNVHIFGSEEPYLRSRRDAPSWLKGRFFMTEDALLRSKRNIASLYVVTIIPFMPLRKIKQISRQFKFRKNRFLCLLWIGKSALNAEKYGERYKKKRVYH